MDGQAPATTLTPTTTQPAEQAKAVVSVQSPQAAPAVTYVRPHRFTKEEIAERTYKANLRAALSAIAYAEGRGFDKERAHEASKALVSTLSNMAPLKHPDRRIAGKKVQVVSIWNAQAEYESERGSEEGFTCHTFICENDTAAWQVLYCFAREHWGYELRDTLMMPDDPRELIGYFFDPQITDWSFDIFTRFIVGEK
jgi:hypothetical protein